MWIKNISLSQNKYYFNLYEFLTRVIHALVGELDVYVGFRGHIGVPLQGNAL